MIFEVWSESMTTKRLITDANEFLEVNRHRKSSRKTLCLGEIGRVTMVDGIEGDYAAVKIFQSQSYLCSCMTCAIGESANESNSDGGRSLKS